MMSCRTGRLRGGRSLRDLYTFCRDVRRMGPGVARCFLVGEAL
jgi:hypothetical protein